MVHQDSNRGWIVTFAGTGINLALGTIDWRPGDRAVTTTLEHPGVTGPLALLRDRVGVDVVEADVGDGGDDERTLDALEAAVAGGRTRAVVASHVAWSTGAVLPAAGIAAMARRHGVVGILDGAQTAGAIPVAVDEVGADFYAVSGQKWLLGPDGTGALAVRRDVVGEALPPVFRQRRDAHQLAEPLQRHHVRADADRRSVQQREIVPAAQPQPAAQVRNALRVHFATVPAESVQRRGVAAFFRNPPLRGVA